MFFRQYDLACLSLYSYLLGDETTGRAVVVDPQRDIGEYLADAEANGLRIERVIETHFHADFLSGHLELARTTGAVISYGDVARTEFPMAPLAHGQRVSLGDVTLEIRHTPGHTPESVSIVVHLRPDAPPWAVLTGDTLFIGDVGRPDLMTSVGRTADSLARDLYRSLHTQLLTLPDDTLVYPAHGAGSACGKHLSSAASSTIGEQRATNYALAPMSEDEFVDAVTEGQGIAPLYFAFTADANRRDHQLLDDHQPPPSLTVEEALAVGRAGAVLIDTRSPESFASGHLRGSVNVGLGGRFAEYAGDVIRPGQHVVLVGDAGRGIEGKVGLARIGFDAVAGEVADVESALAAHPELAASAARLTATDVAAWLGEEPDIQVVDVRNPGETRVGGVIAGARNVPLPRLLDHLDELDPARPTVVYCAGGYRSSIAASCLRAHGFDHVADLIGGYGAWLAATATAS
ncbi:MAG: hydroxyacylglutathione hydrolase [Actinomycetota bacterium]|jgi:glyoxylase-like metal-dependent hydrolase (beta-lactamase superfamily II)/rhodanese-related sulfurtransferase|nr:hydroxyacylglutathione hydrolase [Actinomycetota bacterium]